MSGYGTNRWEEGTGSGLGRMRGKKTWVEGARELVGNVENHKTGNRRSIKPVKESVSGN